MSSSAQYHFVSKTASNFNVCVVLHLVFAILSSVYDSDVSAALAVMGLIAVLNYNVGLLFLYILFTPASILVDIVRMVSVGHHYSNGATGFFVFLRIVEIAIKLAATWFGYSVYKAASEGESGYEQINGGPSQSNVSGAQQSPYVPASYTAPNAPTTGPVVHSMPQSSPA